MMMDSACPYCKKSALPLLNWPDCFFGLMLASIAITVLWMMFGLMVPLSQALVVAVIGFGVVYSCRFVTHRLYGPSFSIGVSNKNVVHVHNNKYPFFDCHTIMRVCWGWRRKSTLHFENGIPLIWQVSVRNRAITFSDVDGGSFTVTFLGKDPTREWFADLSVRADRLLAAVNCIRDWKLTQTILEQARPATTEAVAGSVGDGTG